MGFKIKALEQGRNMHNRKDENITNELSMADYSVSLPLLKSRHLPLSLKSILDYMLGHVTPARCLNDLVIADLMPNLNGTIIEIGATNLKNYKGFANPNNEYILSNITNEEDCVYLNAMNMSLSNNSVDNFVSVTMLEYVPNPRKVISEIHRTLKPGGKLLIVVPFMYPFENVPSDFFRFTDKGLAVMLKEFDIIHAESLGNILSTFALFLQRPFGRPTSSQKQHHKLTQIMITLIKKSTLLLCKTLGLIFYFLSFMIRNPDSYAFLYCLLVNKRES